MSAHRAAGDFSTDSTVYRTGEAVNANSLANLNRNGRRPGSRNRRTVAALSAGVLAAREYADRALAALAEVCEDPEAPAAARVGAARELLNRAYGAPVRFEAVQLRAVGHDVTPETFVTAAGNRERRRVFTRQSDAEMALQAPGFCDPDLEEGKREAADEAEADGRRAAREILEGGGDS